MKILWKIKDWLFDVKMWWQRKTRGYSDIEIWNLDNYIEESVLPRLKVFRENTQAYPSIPGECETFEEWLAIIDEMIFGFEFAINDDDWYAENVLYKGGEEKEKALEKFKVLEERAQKGRELFGKYFTHLWW